MGGKEENEGEIEIFFQIEYDTNFLELVGVRFWDNNTNFIKQMRYRGGKVWTLSIKLPSSQKTCRYQYVILRDAITEEEGKYYNVIREEGGFSTYPNYFLISQSTSSLFNYYLPDKLTKNFEKNCEVQNNNINNENNNENDNKNNDNNINININIGKELTNSQKKIEEFRFQQSSHFLRSLNCSENQFNKIYVIDHWRIEFPTQYLFLYSSSFLFLLNRVNDNFNQIHHKNFPSISQQVPFYNPYNINNINNKNNFNNNLNNNNLNNNLNNLKLSKVKVIFEIEIPQLKSWEKVCILGNAERIGEIGISII